MKFGRVDRKPFRTQNEREIELILANRTLDNIDEWIDIQPNS